MMPPEREMKNDCAWLISPNWRVEAAPRLPSLSAQLPATNETVTLPALSVPRYR